MSKLVAALTATAHPRSAGSKFSALRESQTAWSVCSSWLENESLTTYKTTEKSLTISWPYGASHRAKFLRQRSPFSSVTKSRKISSRINRIKSSVCRCAACWRVLGSFSFSSPTSQTRPFTSQSLTSSLRKSKSSKRLLFSSAQVFSLAKFRTRKFWKSSKKNSPIAK